MKAIVAIVVLVILAGGGYVLYHKNHKSSPASSNTSSNMNMNSSSTSSKSGSSTPSATNSVTIANFAFSPTDITIKKGTKVTWTNNDSTAHTVTGDNGGPNSDSVAPGQSYSFTFSQTGTFKYHCNFHSNMTGSVTVTEK